MSQYAEIRRLAEQEIALRGGADENARIEWCNAVNALRKAVPDWSAVVVELVNELDRVVCADGSTQRGVGARK